MKTKTRLLIAGLVVLSAMVVFTGTAYANSFSSTDESEDPPDTHIPEFSTIAIPIASILGLLFFFSYRKRRRNE